MNKNVLYRSIPKVDILLADEGIKVLIEAYSRESVMEAIHSEMEKLCAYIGTCDDEEKAKHQIALLNENIAKAVRGNAYTEYEKGDQRNRNDPAYEILGRAPISYEHMMKAAGSSVGIPIWNTIWRQEEEESVIRILKSFCVN